MAGMGNIAELLKLLMVGGASGGAGAALGAMGKGDPRIDAMQKLHGRVDPLQQRAQDNMDDLEGFKEGGRPTYPQRELPSDFVDPEFMGFQDQAYPGSTGPRGIRKGDTLGGGPKRPRDPREERGAMNINNKEEDPDDVRDGSYDDRDKGRMSTEDELAMAQKAMDGDDSTPPWDDTDGTVPTPEDFEYLKKFGGDGVIASFLETYPDWSREDLIARGINPGQSPDEYAMSEEDWEDLPENKERSTRINER